MVLETQGAISHRRAKIKVPIAATKRALAKLGWLALCRVALTGVETGWDKPGWDKPGWDKTGWDKTGWDKPECDEPG